MPKIIPELREKILRAARARITEDESHDFSTRQLAADCGVASGTLFNYFSSKEELMACVMLEDWQKCLSRLSAAAEDAGTVSQGLREMEAALRDFSRPFRAVWRRYDRHAPIGQHHAQLIGQMSGPVGRLASRFGHAADETELLVVTEMLLAASQREEGLIDRLIPVVEQIIA